MSIFRISLVFTLLAVWGLQSHAQNSGDSGSSASQGGGSVSANYVLQPYDLLYLRIFQEPDMETEVRVEADGTVRLPLIGVVNLTGKTIAEAQQILFKLYDADYFVNPQVSLQVLQFAERKVNVLGQVNKPGYVLIPPDRPLYLTDAIAGAGGPTRLANLGRIQLKRNLGNGEVISRELDMDRILSEPNARDIPLIDGDTLNVPERRF